MQIIDAHAHLTGDDAMVINVLERLNVHCLNICVSHYGKNCQRERDQYKEIADLHPERYHWITSFEVPVFDDPDYVDRVKAQLDKDFAEGAIACKIWKNIGMEIKKPNGDFMQIDDELLTPIFEHIERSGKLLLAHIGEPYACWQPLSFESPHAPYYRDNQHWHMYNKPDYPSYETIMAAYDRMLRRHPQLKVIGAHLGSQEYSLEAIAKRFDACPNYGIDTGARIRDLALKDPATVKAFFDKYGDRILFGIDIGVAHSEDQDPVIREKRMEEYQHQFKEARTYFDTTGELEVCGKTVRGIGLSEEQQRQFYVENAKRWYQL